MSNQDPTFDGIWLRSGLQAVEQDHLSDETLRFLATTEPATGLPHLSIYEPGSSEDGQESAQLVVRSVLGEGGMGRIHLASQPLLDRDVAIKRVRVDGPRGARAALLREARYMGSLEHPNIVPVHALVADGDGEPILVMKHIVGTQWRELIEDPNHHAWANYQGMAVGVLARNVEILISVCRAMQFAHEKGVLHRDLKPENVMLCDDGSVYVLDWGVAIRLTAGEGGPVVGTPAFMAPEMVDVTAPVRETTDVYLLGACLHKVLTGEPPHRGESLKQVLAAAHAAEPPTFSEGVPEGLATLCRQCLSARPEDRPSTVGEFSRSLVDWIRNRGSAEIAERAEEARLRFADLLTQPNADPQAIAAAFSACRFGFHQALESWPGNLPAKAGLRDALQSMFHYEIGRRNLDHARGLLEELACPEELVPILDEALARQRIQRELAGGQDLSVSIGPRTALVVGIGVLGALITVGLFSGIILDVSKFQTLHLVELAVGLNMVVWLFIFAGRHWLFRNAVNAAFTRAVILIGTAVIVGRFLALSSGLTPAQTLTQELVMLGAALGTTGVFTQDRGMAAGGAIAGLSALACALLPDHALLIYGTVTMFGFAFGAIYGYRLNQ
ncbi:MAG: serine/threonine protein kinase [Proteobacteria bacterium]|nr:serine/threonine protein kinase [Pseudomonadota bacterium]